MPLRRGVIAYPFQTRGETGTTSATQTRCLDLRDDLQQVSHAPMQLPGLYTPSHRPSG
jgi:hypothetical protein